MRPCRNPDGKGNYLFADIQGKGHYVGVNYYVQYFLVPETLENE